MSDQPNSDNRPMRPGKNGKTGKPQGQLKTGNTVNVGRLRKEVRLKCAMSASEGVEYWDKVARGLKVIAEYQMGQKKLRFPTHNERMRAIEHLVEIGIGRQDKLEVEDTTRLTNEERRRMLVDRANESIRKRNASMDGG